MARVLSSARADRRCHVRSCLKHINEVVHLIVHELQEDGEAIPEDVKVFGRGQSFSENISLLLAGGELVLSGLSSTESRRLNFQSFFAVGSLDTLIATPTINGLSPILNAVPD